MDICMPCCILLTSPGWAFLFNTSLGVVKSWWGLDSEGSAGNSDKAYKWYINIYLDDSLYLPICKSSKVKRKRSWWRKRWVDRRGGRQVTPSLLLLSYWSGSPPEPFVIPIYTVWEEGELSGTSGVVVLIFWRSPDICTFHTLDIITTAESARPFIHLRQNCMMNWMNLCSDNLFKS